MVYRANLRLPFQLGLEFFDLGADGAAVFVAAAGGFFLSEPRAQQERRREGDEHKGEDGLEMGRHRKVVTTEYTENTEEEMGRLG